MLNSAGISRRAELDTVFQHRRSDVVTHVVLAVYNRLEQWNHRTTADTETAINVEQHNKEQCEKAAQSCENTQCI